MHLTLLIFCLHLKKVINTCEVCQHLFLYVGKNSKYLYFSSMELHGCSIHFRFCAFVSSFAGNDCVIPQAAKWRKLVPHSELVNEFRLNLALQPTLRFAGLTSLWFMSTQSNFCIAWKRKKYNFITEFNNGSTYKTWCNTRRDDTKYKGDNLSVCAMC